MRARIPFKGGELYQPRASSWHAPPSGAVDGRAGAGDAGAVPAELPMKSRLAALLAVPFLGALPLGAQVTTKLIAGGLTRPLWAGAPDGDPRIFIVQKGGFIRILENGQVLT